MTVAKVDDNLLCDEAVRDPHAYFGRLRDEAVVQWNDRHRSWVVTGYADVVEGLRGNKLTAERIAPFAESILRSSDPAGPPSALAVLADWLVFKDPPDHTRLRKLVARAFTPGSVRVRGTEIQRTIDGLLDDLADREEADLIEHFAYPLPAIVIAGMLGAPAEDRCLFKHWSDLITSLVFGAYDRDDRHARAASGMAELCDYLLALIDRFSREPADNLISVLLQSEDDDALSREELVATCTLLLFGGHETTTNLIANGTRALLQFPDQLSALRSDPQLMPTAVEEILRFDGPARATVRLVREDHELGGQLLQAGQRVFLVNLAANRDPTAFPEPDRLDIRRNPNLHLGFGFGIHYCLGAPLARIEAQLALTSLIGRFPALAPAGDEPLQWHPTMLSRGLVKLPVRLR